MDEQVSHIYSAGLDSTQRAAETKVNSKRTRERHVQDWLGKRSRENHGSDPAIP